MTFTTGDRVTLLRTGKSGTVSAVLEKDMFQVRLDGGLGHLPVPGHAMAPLDGSSTAADTPAPDAPSERRNSTHDTGIHLAFDPIFDESGEPERYQLYLINGTGSKILYEIKVLTGERSRTSKFGPLGAYEKKSLADVPYGFLNERLAVDLDVRAVVEGGTGPRHFHQVKVRPKQFFSSYREVPELSRGAHLFTVFPHLEAVSVADRNSGTSLRELTRAQLKKQPQSAAAPPRLSSLEARNAFNPVLDLHLEALVEDPKAIARDKVLSTQLEHFDRFIDKALRLDVERVVIVHGLGNGILKTELHRKLEHTPFVKKFANEYHPKYGYGATEVIFES
ncbi:Smr/MutS family protein [Lewinella sp. IMCC34183]|uniref:Smr/MutS family protein n=1 Tax=Lewinella sp. IMCC34183 TaxID=2248762 RepID=UPI000E280A21|nr:Smr/MutS family protein [Lewinella sp. IMCC34183]